MWIYIRAFYICVYSLTFSAFSILAFTSRGTSFLPIWLPCNSFSCLNALARTPCRMSNRSHKNQHPCLVSDFSTKDFWSSPTGYDASCWLCIYTLCHMGEFTFNFCTLSIFFNHEWMLDFCHAFLLMWYINLIIIYRPTLSFLG